MKAITTTILACLLAATAQAQPPAGRGRGNQEPGPTITVRGHTFTQLSLFQRNVGGPDDMTTPFPPHKVIGNIYYVGTKSLAVFLIVTPQGHILINSTYERNVPGIQKAVEQLGFKFSDIKILLGSHAHGDHQEGDALVKSLTGAQVMAMAEDVPALEAMKPGGKPHPIDKVLRDGESVTLGSTTLVAHLTPGHSRGCTTWTLKAEEGGKSYDVVIIGSFGTNPGLQAGEQRGDAAHRRGIRTRVQSRALARVRRPAGVASGDVQHDREVLEAREQRRQPVHRSRRIPARSGHRRGDVSRRACRTA